MQKSSNKDRTNKLHEACFHSRQKRVCGDCGPALDGKAYIREISKRNALKEIAHDEDREADGCDCVDTSDSMHIVDVPYDKKT